MNCESNMLMSFRKMVSGWISWFQSRGTSQNIQTFSRCLDVSGDGGPGSRVRMVTCNGGARQKWYFDDIQRLHPVYNPNLCLDIAGASDADAAFVIVWNCHGGANQQWYTPCKKDGEYCT